ncbi:hypothetical protein BDN70DRAFT_105345 [Pholiota conissans]|uniref:Secreted protein n=1 Tax=Pholiota conissans TaxID=109636 RepID=A0A9P5ZER8_9AGAR|nr:hypothetical protein BDN70DRAFT_105345 [Pholiota conissans]
MVRGVLISMLLGLVTRREGITLSKYACSMNRRQNVDGVGSSGRWSPKYTHPWERGLSRSQVSYLFSVQPVHPSVSFAACSPLATQRSA